MSSGSLFKGNKGMNLGSRLELALGMWAGMVHTLQDCQEIWENYRAIRHHLGPGKLQC